MKPELTKPRQEKQMKIPDWNFHDERSDLRGPGSRLSFRLGVVANCLQRVVILFVRDANATDSLLTL